MLGGRPASDIENYSQKEFETVSEQFNLIFFTIFGILVLMLVIANVLSYIREKKKQELKTIPEN